MQCMEIFIFFPLSDEDNGRDSYAIIWGYDGPNMDSTCPAGKPATGLLELTGRQSFTHRTGAPRLCAGSIYTFTTVGQ